MERIEGTQMLLLRDHLQDGEIVSRVLTRLEDLKVIRVMRKRGRTLSFFADERSEPAAIIMFLNSNETFGIYLSDNYYLLSMQKHGVRRLPHVRRCKVSTVDMQKTCLTDFLSRLSLVRGKSDHVLN